MSTTEEFVDTRATAEDFADLIEQITKQPVKPVPLPVFAKNIPLSMRKRRQWVVWRYERRGEKWSKIPYVAGSDRPAKTNNKSTWRDFDFCLEQYKAGKADGIGYVFAEGDGLAGIDLDHCFDGQEPRPEAKAIIAKFEGLAYFEKSVGGDGGHLIVKGEMAKSGKGSGDLNWIEGYDYKSPRYFTFSGHRWEGTSVEEPQEAQEALDWLHANYLKQAEKVLPEGTTARVFDPADEADDDRLIARIRKSSKHGDKFSQLFDDGTLVNRDTDETTTDQSTLDMKLVEMLAFWCSRDEEQMDRLFRRSALMRDKWDSSRGAGTYGLMTIAKGIKYNLEHGGSAFKDTQTAVALDPAAKFLGTDLRNADRIIERFGAQMMVVSGAWYRWVGTHWEEDAGDGMNHGLKLSSIIIEEANAYEARPAKTEEDRKANDAISKALMKWVKKSENRAAIDAALNIVKRRSSVSADSLDKDVYLLNCLNGTVDLRDGSLKPHDPDDHITRLIPLDYNPEARAPAWEQAVSEIMGEDDLPSDQRKLVGFLRRWLGYSASGSTREQKFAVHWGSGSNGKSTIIGVVEKIMAGYWGTAAPDLLKESKGDRHPTEIADLRGRRGVTVHETDNNLVIREGFVKQATGSDSLKGRKMRQDFFEFDPTHKINLLTNHKPTIKSQDDGIWRRVMLIPYRSVFGAVVGECDPNQTKPATHIKVADLQEKLNQESDGILAWVIAGAVEWYQGGLNPPQDVIDASARYKHEQDRVQAFVDEECDLGFDKSVRISDIYQSYTGWSRDGGTHALSKHKFLERLESIVPNFQKDRRKEQRYGMGARRSVDYILGIGCEADL